MLDATEILINVLCLPFVHQVATNRAPSACLGVRLMLTLFPHPIYDIVSLTYI